MLIKFVRNDPRPCTSSEAQAWLDLQLELNP